MSNVLGPFRPAHLGLLAALPFALLASPAGAVGTRTFVLDSPEKLGGGELDGTSVGSDGAVRAGLALGATPLQDASAVFTAHTLADGSVILGTSPNGKAYRAVGDAVSLFADTKELAVTAVAELKGVVYLATMPEGRIYKVAGGKMELFTTLPETSHVWALVADKKTPGLFAATGPDGKIFRVEPNGQSSVHLKTTESHLVSLAQGDDGVLYAGSSGKGRLYRVDGPGRARVLHDLPGEEVRAVAVGKGGVVYAIGNEYGEAPEPPKRSPAAGRVAPGPVPQGAKPKPGKGSLFRVDAKGRPERLMRHEDTHYTSLALDERGAPLVGTGEGGRVYTVDDGHVVHVVADVKERQVGAVALAGQKGYVATSDPPVFHRVTGRGGADAVWTSKVLDAGLVARFGKLSWQAQGAIELSTRTGNTQSPDATWSAWSAGVATPSAIASPPGRFVQVRARWSRDPSATLASVTLPFVTENARAVVLDVSAAPKGAPAKEPGSSNLPASGDGAPKRESVVKVVWKTDNPDNDALRFRVWFKREGQATWRDALKDGEVLTKAELEWDTSALPEGLYRLRVEASDELANTAGDATRHARDSEPFVVDNTPPTVPTLTLAGRRLQLRAVDGTSAIARVELAVDGRTDFRPVPAADGVYDEPEERVDADVAALVPPGSHLVAVRVFDAAGNMVVRDVEAR